MFQILAVVVALEAVSIVALKETLDGKRAPGDFGFDPLSFSAGKSDKVKAEFAAKEIENGRLAMLAFGGIVTQAVLNDKGFPYF
jgi:light-harvesting complex I chlorophyll a/b binding protein 1